MKLYYLALRARAEPLRMLLLHAKVHVEYCPIPLADWPAMKPTMPQGKNGKQQVPVLELDDGTKMPESLDIAKYICTQVTDEAERKALLGGDHPEKAEQAWKFTDTLGSSFGSSNPLLNWHSVQDAEPKIAEFLPKVADAYQEIDAVIGNGPYVCGSAPSYGDFVIFHHLDLIFTLDGGATLAQHDGMRAYWERMSALPAVQAHLRQRAGVSVGRPGSILESVQGPHELPVVQEAIRALQ